MASKQAKNKEAQNYVAKPIQRMCSNCAHFRIDKTTEKSFGGTWIKESNARCEMPDFGGFAVKKMANCDMHKFNG